MPDDSGQPGIKDFAFCGILGEGEFGAAVDRCLAAVRLAEDQRRYRSPYVGGYAVRPPLRTLVRLADRLPPEEIARAAEMPRTTTCGCLSAYLSVLMPSKGLYRPFKQTLLKGINPLIGLHIFF